MTFKSKFNEICKLLISFIFLVNIVFVTYYAFVEGGNGELSKPLLSLLIAVNIAAVVIFNIVANKFEDKLEKHFSTIFIIYLAIMFVVQTIPAEALRFTPAWDLDAVFGGAISWINNGDLHEYNDYFLWFPNNFGLLTINKIAFTIARIFGGDNTDYYSAAVFMGSLSLAVTRFSVTMVCKKTLGTSAAYCSMIAMLLCPTMYFMSMAFYTDVLSLWAAPLSILLFIYGRQSEKLPRKIGFYLGSALSAAIGSEIKFTVVIAVIALAITLFIRLDFKELGIFAAAQLLVFAIIFSSFNALYNANFDAQRAEIQNTPLYHWIMMGAKGDGRYNGEDYVFTRSFENTHERDAALKEEIINRYKERGLNGTLELWKNKTIIDYGDGTLGISDFLDDGVVKPSKIHDWLLYNGSKYQSWQTICNGEYISLLIFMIAAVFSFIASKSDQSTVEDIAAEDVKLALFMNFIGLWLFLMFWEASPRYFSNSYGVIIISAVVGVSAITSKLKKKN